MKLLGNIIKSFLISLFFVFLILFSFLIYNAVQLKIDKSIALSSISQASTASEEIENDQPVKNWNVSDLDLSAKSAISFATNIIDSNGDKVLFSKSEKEKLPIASLTKLMTAIIVIDNYDLSDSVVIGEKPDYPESIKLGDIQSVNNLLHIMLIASSNKAAFALSQKVGEKEFVWLMNEKAKYLGLENTYFIDSTGLSDNYSTAEDLSKLAIYILKNYPKIVQISEVKEIGLPGIGKIENTNKLLGTIPGIIIGKTGFTLDAKQCLLLATYNPKAKNYLVNIILGSDDRFMDMQNLINWINYAYTWRKVSQ